MLLLAGSEHGYASELARSSSVQIIHAASAELTPEQGPERVSVIQLPFQWDKAFPGQGGIAVYKIELPGSTDEDEEPLALLLEGLGNQATVYIDETEVLRLGMLGDPRHDSVKESNVVALPPALRTTPGKHQLWIVATAQRQRGAGMGAVRVGPAASLQSNRELQQQWTRLAPLVYLVSLVLMGGLAAGLWLRQRDALYGCFCLAALTGVPRNMDRTWMEVPIPWPTWGAIVAVCYTLHIALIARFVLLVLDKSPIAMVRALHIVIAAAVALAAASFIWAAPAMWSLGLALLLVFSLACVPIVVAAALRDKEPVAWVLLVAGVIALTAGSYDLFVFRLGLLGGASSTFTEHAMFLFVLILAGLVVERYSRTVKEYRQLNSNLVNLVSQQEAKLQQADAILAERQRMMREIHDGVGSQLVGLRNVLGLPSFNRSTVVEHIEVAMDEMRMAVDSLQPTQDNLGIILATLRYRLRARLEAAGIHVVWEVDQLLAAVPVSAQECLQVQRIMLEAFTNILKHAKASQIVFRAGRDPQNPQWLTIEVSDNGIGLPEPSDGTVLLGQGLTSMHERARSIEARLVSERMASGGTRIELRWPLEPGAIDPTS